MNLAEVEARGREMLELAEMFATQYNNIAMKLVNIYNIVSKTNSQQARDLKQLIDKYDATITEIREVYGQEVNEIISYANVTNENLMQLAENIRVITKVYNDMLASIQQ